LVAALTVALFTIPQAMAYALIAGFSPFAGIVTAIAASILGATFGSSEFLVDGPTNAISAMLASNVAILASQGDPRKLVVLLTLLIGVSQIVVSWLRGGTLTRFVSEPVLIGFTAGAGIYIAVNQLPSAMGLGKKDVIGTLWGWKPPADVVFDFLRTILSFGKANVTAIGVVIATILLVRVFNLLDKKVNRRLPATFLTVIIVSIAAYVFGFDAAGPSKLRLVLDIEPITRSLPKIIFPEIQLDKVLALIGPAFAIGILGAVEAVAIGKSLAAQAGHRFDANRQLIGEGASNIGAALVGGFAASGSFTRTAVNYEAGAISRMSALMSGLLVLAIVIILAPVANYIPVAVLAGLLIHIGVRLMNLGKLKLVIQTSKTDRVVLATTFFAVLLLPSLACALFVGVGLSIVLALRKAEGFRLRVLEEDSDGNLVESAVEDWPHRVITLDLQGEMFFAASDVLEQKLHAYLDADTLFIVLRLQQAYNLDSTCAEALKNIARAAKRSGGRLILSGVRPGVYRMMERASIISEIGPEAVFQAEPTLLGSTHKAREFAHQLAASASQS
jgi:SulP family sulfate permease